MKLQSYWRDTAEPFAHAADGLVEGHADVAVVGRGFTGLSAALHLAKPGGRVVVLERGFVGSGASGRSGAHLNKVRRIAS
jgi:glycine/D-amino acid oxidase-like deaminating enzyme